MTETKFGEVASKNEQVISAKLRFSGVRDSRKIIQFYKDNHVPTLAQRTDNWYEHCARNGGFLMLVRDNGDILACSAAYRYKNAQGEVDHTEIGSTLSFTKGFSLYPFIISAQTTYDFLARPPKTSFVARVAKDKPEVHTLLNKACGWPASDPADDVKKTAKKSKTSKTGEGSWYESPISSAAHQAGVVKDFIDQKDHNNVVRLTSKKNKNEVLEIDLSDFPLANELYPAIQMMVQRQGINILGQSYGQAVMPRVSNKIRVAAGLSKHTLDI